MTFSYSHPVLLLALHLGPFNASAGTCTTVLNGVLTAPSIWDCGCDPAVCDTLVIAHQLTLDGDHDLYNPVLIIAEQGHLTTTGHFVVHGALINHGTMTTPHMRLWGTGNAYNHGTITGNVLICVKDTTFNHGAMHLTDSLVVGVYRVFQNRASIDTDILYHLGWFRNSGDCNVGAFLGPGPSILNEETGTIRAETTFSARNPLSNDGTIGADSVLVAHSLHLTGSIQATSYFATGITGNGGDGDLWQGSIITTRDFSNAAGFILRGPGSICISGHAENHGELQGSLDICDATPTMTEPPYLDVNTGTCWPSVRYCANGVCAALGMADTRADRTFSAYPVPTNGPLTLDLTAFGMRVRRIDVLDPTGRSLFATSGNFTGSVTIDLSEIAAGPMLVTLRDAAGSVVATRAIVIE